MREILFRGKRKDNGEWVYGDLVNDWSQHNTKPDKTICNNIGKYLVISETVGEYTGISDGYNNAIFEDDIVQYTTYDDFDCQSVVKFGEYKQDGSDGEYRAVNCIGFYVEVDNFTCPDWCENKPERFDDWRERQNILEVAKDCLVIGNIHDNPEILV